MSNSSASPSTSATPTTPSLVSTPSTPPSSTSSKLSPSSSASTTSPTSISSISTPPPSSSSSPPISTSTTFSDSSISTRSTTSTISSSSPFSTSTPPPQSFTSSSSSSTSTFLQTTVITTDAQGSVVTVLTTAAPSNTPGTTTTGASSTSHTGAIVGGVVGGVAALAILAFILILCLRRQRRKDDFDGNFDPDRVAHSHGPLDLAAAEVEPYTYPQENTHAGGQVDMRQTPLAAGNMHQYYDTSVGAQPDYEGSRSPTDTHTTTSFLSPNAAPVAGLAYAPSSSSHSPPRSAKEREAFSRYNTTASSGSGNALQAGSSDTGMHVVNQPDDSVVVHQDGGRVRVPVEEERVEREIPPTYDSIPSDSRH